jgi:hypothetical protein
LGQICQYKLNIKEVTGCWYTHKDMLDKGNSSTEICN